MDSLIQYLMCVYVTILVTRVDCYIQNVILNAPVNISCPHSTTVRINNVSVLQDDNTVCKEYRKNCNIMEEDLQVIKEACKNSSTCMFNLNVTTSCVHDYEYFNISYMCKGPTTYKCDFDHDSCNWLSQGWTATTKGQIADTTIITERENDQYFYIKANGISNVTATLKSGTIVSTNRKCLTFWHVVYGKSTSLNVHQINRNQEDIHVDCKFVTTRNKWTQSVCQLEVFETYYIVIEGTVVENGSIVLDDTDIFDGICTENTNVTCNFETSSCNWTSHCSVEWRWIQDIESDVFNIIDHTTGNRKYMEILTWQAAGTGCLISPPINPNKHKCLSFWYYIYGRSIKSFEVKQKSWRISLIDINIQEKWTHQLLNIYGDDQYQITFEANFDQDILDNPLRRIVIDDVTIADGLCAGETLYTHECLQIDMPFQMKECPLHDFLGDTFNIELQRRIPWTGAEACNNKMTNNLKRMVDYCKDTDKDSTCIILPSVFLTDDNDCFVIKQTKRLQIHYSCTDFSITTSTPASSATDSSTPVRTTIGDLPDSAVQSARTSNTTGIIVGVVLGFGVFAGLVAILLCFIRRSQSIPKKPGGVDNILSNDYIGHQSLALPVLRGPMSKDDDYAKIQGKNDNYQHFNSHGLKTSIDASSRNFDKLDQLKKGSDNKARNNMHEDDVTNHDYIYFDETEAGSTQMWIKSPGANTSQEEIQKKNEYAVIDPNNDHSRGNENYTRHATSPSNNYAILDPNETGFFRSKVNEETITDYDFAVPLDNNEVVSDLQDAYSVVENGAYDTTGKVRLQETYTNIYSHTAETTYDTSSHKRKNVENDGTYDRFFGDKTEDNYNITKRE